MEAIKIVGLVGILIVLGLIFAKMNDAGTIANIVGANKDSHGCIGSAGYSWCENKQKCVREWEEPCEANLTASQAIQIAKNSDCAENGEITSKYVYNEITKTWWIDINVQKKGCNPACVVRDDTNETSISWRCTGLTPGDV